MFVIQCLLSVCVSVVDCATFSLLRLWFCAALCSRLDEKCFSKCHRNQCGSITVLVHGCLKTIHARTWKELQVSVIIK